MPKLSSINLSAKVPLYEAMETSTKGVRLARNRTAAQIKAVLNWLEPGMPMETRTWLRGMLTREVDIAYDSLDISDPAPEVSGFATEGHPVTLSEEMCAHLLGSGKTFYEMLTEAARWGANTELEACVEWLGDAPVTWEGDEDAHPGSFLRDARRPTKLPTLKKQALEEMRALERYMKGKGEIAINFQAIRRAMEALPDSND